MDMLSSSVAALFRTVAKPNLLQPTSSTEAEFLAAVLTAKQAQCPRSILKELGFEQPGPAALHCDNQLAINMAKARVPTERSRHIDIQHFAIQDWKEAGDIIKSFIPGIINPSDDLTKPLRWILHARHDDVSWDITKFIYCAFVIMNAPASCIAS